MIEMQVGLLTLLKEFDAICRKHSITYYLEGGSLLGAVRHKGFLPWDDDIDLSITRDNFQKLLAVIDEELPENRELYCYERFPNYLRDTVKFANLDTTVLFPNHILDGNAAGQHIDLFILDPVPSDPAKQEEYKKNATIYSELLTPVYVLCDGIVEYMEEYEQYLQLIEDTSREEVLASFREKLFTYEDSDECDTYLLRWGNRHIFYPKELFGEPVYLEFEDGKFPAPSQYYRFLRRQFGDSWMIVPETAEQEDHKTYDKYKVPCKTFIADYSPFIDYEVYWHDNSARKHQNLRFLNTEHQMRESKILKRFIADDIAASRIAAEMTKEAKSLLKNKRYGELVEYFEPYLTAQLDSEYLGGGLAIAINPSVLHACVLSMTICGQFGQAEKLLKINGGIKSKKLKELQEFITDIRACMLASEEERFSDAKELALKWIDSYPEQLNLSAFLIRQAMRENVPAEELISRVEKLLERYPESDELLFLMGMLFAKLGKDEEAEVWYRRCKEITRNGLILMELPELPEEDSEDGDSALEEE